MDLECLEIAERTGLRKQLWRLGSRRCAPRANQLLNPSVGRQRSTGLGHQDVVFTIHEVAVDSFRESEGKLPNLFYLVSTSARFSGPENSGDEVGEHILAKQLGKLLAAVHAGTNYGLADGPRVEENWLLLVTDDIVGLGDRPWERALEIAPLMVVTAIHKVDFFAQIVPDIGCPDLIGERIESDRPRVPQANAEEFFEVRSTRVDKGVVVRNEVTLRV